MRKAIKVWLCVAAALVAVGTVAFVGLMAANQWDFGGLDTVKYETNTHTVEEEFSRVSITTDTADVEFRRSEDGSCRVISYEPKNLKHSVAVVDGILTVKVEDSRRWYEHISFFSFSTPRLTVYLPEKEYAELTVSTTTGDISIPADISVGSMELSVSTGDVQCKASARGIIRIRATTGDLTLEGVTAERIELRATTGDLKVTSASCIKDLQLRVTTGDIVLSDVRCESLVSNGSTGGIRMTDVLASGDVSVTCGTGSIRLEACDAGSLSLTTNTGDVKGSLRTGKRFDAETNTGSVRVPSSVAEGGGCRIRTGTGDIRITVP